MSFNIIMQRNNSEREKMDKDLSDLATLTGTLKNETSIIDPVIMIEGNVSSYSLCNYMTIPEFNRRYFITNIRSIRNGLFEVHAHVDVLTTFAGQIRANAAIIRRQQNAWNLYLNDGSFRVYQNPMVLTKAFPSGFDTMEFVLGVAGAAHAPT